MDYRYLGSAHVAALIDALLAKDTGRRLKDAELRLHPFFWGLEWSRLEKRQLTTPHASECRARAMAMTQKMQFAPLAPRAAAQAEAPPPVMQVQLPEVFARPAAAADAPRAKQPLADGSAEASGSGNIEEWPDELDISEFICAAMDGDDAPCDAP